MTAMISASDLTNPIDRARLQWKRISFVVNVLMAILVIVAITIIWYHAIKLKRSLDNVMDVITVIGTKLDSVGEAFKGLKGLKDIF